MTEVRSHEAYLQRVVIPPIMIPTTPKALQKAPIQSPLASRIEKRPAPTGTNGCLCGCIKVTAGYLMCPLICPISCIAGSCREIYHALTCDKYNDGTDPYKLCVWFGCYNACIISSAWIEEGAADMRRKPQGEQDMVR